MSEDFTSHGTFFPANLLTSTARESETESESRLIVCMCVLNAEHRGSKVFNNKTATSCWGICWTAWNRKRSKYAHTTITPLFLSTYSMNTWH